MKDKDWWDRFWDYQKPEIEDEYSNYNDHFGCIFWAVFFLTILFAILVIGR